LFGHISYLKLTVCYHETVIQQIERLRSSIVSLKRPIGRQDTAEHAMKIYLLMTLFGILFTAIHFTSAPKQDAKPVSQ
jgi:hypothetical protein